jgi:hypothetical protein
MTSRQLCVVFHAHIVTALKAPGCNLEMPGRFGVVLACLVMAHRG